VGAAQYVNRQLAVLPVLRPLVLAVKAYLRENGLNEASVLRQRCCLHLVQLPNVLASSARRSEDVIADTHNERCRIKTVVHCPLSDRRVNCLHMQVFSGGLSSYTLSSMCMAHLQAEGLAAAVPAAVASDAASGGAQPAVDLQATPLAAASPAALDAGRLLHSFFARFGHAFR
jgi:hypothetical protein